MKRFCILILLLAIISSLCACGGDSHSGRPAADAPSSNAPSSNAPSSDAPSSNAPSSDAPALQPDYSIVESEPETIGYMTLDDLDDVDYMTGFLIHYPDDSFDYYEGGQVITWGVPELYTYGTEQSAYNLVMAASGDRRNQEKLKNGELVFITSKDTKVYAHFYPVIESGYALFGENASGKTEVLLFKHESGSQFDYVNGFERTPKQRKITTINGVYIDREPIFEKDENHKYVTLNEGDEYVIGEANGTTLIENTYSADRVYYLHTYHTGHTLYNYPDKAYAFELQPTTYGYANVDFSELPPGDYVAMYSYWNENYGQRNAYITHIVID